MDCCDLSLFQLSLLGQEGGGKFEYAQWHFFHRFFILHSSLTQLMFLFLSYLGQMLLKFNNLGQWGFKNVKDF